MTKPVLNLADVELRNNGHGTQFAAKLGRIGPKIGAKGLGCSLIVVPPGKRAFPFHVHHVNEEMFFILSGTGTLRYGPERYAVRAGDVIASPPGGVEVAHQLINDGREELRYLAFSTLTQPEVVEYPDSGKFAVMSGMPPSGDYRQARVAYIGRKENSLDYWDGEGT
jgi:uncharacterized cupin superfamily protein